MGQIEATVDPKHSNNYTAEEILAQTESFMWACELDNREMSQKADEHWKSYVGYKKLVDVSRIQSIYAEALSKDKSLDWAEGKIEGEGLEMPDLWEGTPWAKTIEKLKGLFS